MERLYSPSPTVRGSRIPLYLRGSGPFLGDDGMDPTSIPLSDTPVFEDPYQFQIPQLAPIFTPSIPGLDTTSIPNPDNVMLTAPPIAQVPSFSAGQSASAAAQIAAAIASGAKGIATATTGPSPRIATTPIPGVTPGSSILTQSSIVKGIPDIAVIGGVLLLILAAGKR